MIPEFTDKGILPPGIHQVTWSEFAKRFGINQHRQQLLNGLWSGLESLKIAGCRRVYVDGSFVTTKEFPGDFDALWEADGVDRSILRITEPTLLEFANSRAAQKAKFGGEFFPILLYDGTWNLWMDFFQKDREGNPKGIVALDLGNLK